MRDPLARRLLGQTPAARRPVVLTGALAVLTTGLILAQAALLAEVLARGATGRATVSQLTGPLIALAAVSTGRAIVTGLFELAGRLGAQRVMSELRTRVAERLLVARPAAASGKRSGELVTAAVQGVDALETWFARYLPQVALSAFVPVTILVFLVPQDLTATIVLAATVPVLIVFMVLVGLTAKARTEARWHALSLLGAHFSDVVRGLPTLRAHVREQAQAKTMDNVTDAYRRETMATLRVAFLSALILELVAMMGTALVAASVGLQLVAGDVTLQTGLTVLILCPELYAPLRAAGQQFHAGAEGLASADSLFAVLDEPAAVNPATATLPAPDPAVATIVFDDVSFAYPGRDGDVVCGVTLELHPGETVALVGPSGAGKSTLSSLVLRLADPDYGTITCGGIDLRDIDVDAWRRRIAWLPQRPTIFAGTVADNIAMGAASSVTDEEITAAARSAHADEFIRTLPDGYATRVGDGGRPLSAGQAQRLALARALIRDAALLVLDEPTAHLDAATAADLDEALHDVCRGRTALLIVHREELARRADRVVELIDGAIVQRPRAKRRSHIAPTHAPDEVAA